MALRRTRIGAALAVLLAVALAAAPAGAQSGAPAVQARSAIVVEASTGDVAFQRNASERRSIASTTKLMTALLALEGISLDDTLTAVDYPAGAAESLVGLRAGERMKVRDLLRALLLPSANDAAETLAVGVSGSVPSFVREMNRRAEDLGLRDTSYANPVGLDEPGNRSSARDLVRLTTVLRRKPFFRETVDMPRAILRSGARRRVVANRNNLVVQVPFVNGVKTGRTLQAGYVLVGSATRDGVTVISAVLGEPTEAARDADTLALLRYGLGRYRRERVVERGETLARADLKYRDERVRLVAGTEVDRVLRRGQKATSRVVGAPKEVDGPMPAGEQVGTVEVLVRDKVVARAPLITATAVEEAGIGTRIVATLTRPLSLLLILLLGACTVFLMLLRRRVVRRTGAR